MKNICIIGAGISGVSAAMHLIENGFSVDIYEAAPEIGGRISSVYDQKTDETIDNGQHLLVGAYHRFLYILRKLRTDGKLKYQNGLNINYLDEKSNHFKLNTGALPGDFGQLIGILRFNALNFSEKISLIKLALKIKYFKTKSDKSCKDFLKAHSQSDNSIKYFWEPLVLATINNTTEDAPAQLLINILRDAFFKDKKSSSLIFPQTDLKNLIANFEQYVNINDSEIHTKSKVSEIIVSDDRVVGIKLKSGEIKQYNKIISTLPPFSLKKILPEMYANNQFLYLSKFSYSPILSAYLWYDKNYLSEDIYALIGTKTQWVFNKRNFSDENHDISCLLSLTISNAEKYLKLPQREIVAMLHKEICTILPEFKKSELIHSRIIVEKMATFKANIQTEKKRPLPKTNIEGLYLAGDWTKTGYPATIEGAALSGLNAAKLIV